VNKDQYIQGYPNQPSIYSGEVVKMHVSTTTPRFKIAFYRQGKSLEYAGSSDWFEGLYKPPGDPGESWLWPTYHFQVPFNWRPGVYIAFFIPGDNYGETTDSIPSLTPDGRESKALFVIKSRDAGKSTKILYKIPIFTYFAYNHAFSGDKCFYRDDCSRITLHKPGGGTGGTPWDTEELPDEYDQSSPRHTFAHWDAKFISWLEGNGYDVDYCTDLDIHQDNGSFLQKYQLLLSVGQDEYWSESMRSNAESFIKSGKNVAFFSGNTCWWRVSVDSEGSAILCDKTIHEGDLIGFDQWCRFDPENRLTGVSYRNGGGRWTTGQREAVGYRVQCSNHWVFNNTGLNNADVFGKEDFLVGYECDGADVKVVNRDKDNNFFAPTTLDGTPSNFKILAIAFLNNTWDEFKDKNYSPPSGALNSTLGIYNNNGTVFTAPTTDWARVLLSGNNIVNQITRNVIDKLSKADEIPD
jgi:hypothetical protein